MRSRRISSVSLPALSWTRVAYKKVSSLLALPMRCARGLDQLVSSQDFVGGLNQIANILSLQGRWQEATAAYAEIEEVIKTWDSKRRGNFQLNNNRAHAFYGTGRVEEGLRIAHAGLARNEARGAVAQLDTAVSRGLVAIGLGLAGRQEEALAEFRKSAPLLHGYDTDIDDVAKIHVTSVQPVHRNIRDVSRAFGQVWFIRHRSGQGRIPDSGGSTRRETRLCSEGTCGIECTHGPARSQPRGCRPYRAGSATAGDLAHGPAQPYALAAVRGTVGSSRHGSWLFQVDKLRADRAKIKTQLERKFPRYAELIDPKPPQLDEIRSLLKPHEAYVSFYFGRHDSYAWAFRKEGAAAFTALGITASELRTAVTKLREPLDSPLNEIEQIPAFNLQPKLATRRRSVRARFRLTVSPGSGAAPAERIATRLQPRSAVALPDAGRAVQCRRDLTSHSARLRCLADIDGSRLLLEPGRCSACLVHR